MYGGGYIFDELNSRNQLQEEQYHDEPEKLADFEERIANGAEKIEPGDWMPVEYRAPANTP